MGPVSEQGDSAQDAGEIRGKAHTSLHDVGEGVVGAAGMVLAFLTPMLREFRSHWGIDPDLADRTWPGDDLVATPRWTWTHGVEIDAPVDYVWPWVAQMGQGKGGFYSYAFLENVIGCDVENAEDLHPPWTLLHVGDTLSLHPKMPPLPIAAMEPGRWFVVHGRIDPYTSAPTEARESRFVDISWLFWVEPLPGRRTRFVSRFRVDHGDDLGMRLAYGPEVIEPVGFVMDRRMLLGVKARAECAWRERPDAP